MSDDLISRKALVSNLKLFLDRSFLGETTAHDCISVGEIVGLIKDEPTAYDVDKVVERLERNSQNIELIYPTDQGYDYEDAIGIDINRAKEIVKAGGVNE